MAPKTKTKKAVKKVVKAVKDKFTKSNIDKEQSAKIAILKNELNYFKGLSIMITILIVCVFFAFGSLFMAMYWETKIMRITMQDAVEDLVLLQDGNDIDLVYDEEEPVFEEEEVVMEDIDWLSFEKYGVETFFPDSWTFMDNPYVRPREIHFFADGQVHDVNSSDVGDFYVEIASRDLYTEKSVSKTESEPTNYTLYGEKVIAYFSGEDEVQTVWLLENDDTFYGFHFATDEARELLTEILQKVELD